MVAIRRHLLIDILYDAAVAEGVDLRLGCEVTRVEQRPAERGFIFQMTPQNTRIWSPLLTAYIPVSRPNSSGPANRF